MIPIRRDKRAATLTRLFNRANTNYHCCVGGCRNTQKESKLSFFALPKDAERRTVWLKVIGRNDLLDKIDYTGYKVCAKHFTKKSISEWYARILLPDAMPTKYLPTGPRLGIMDYHREPGFSEVATQTDITYGSEPTKVKVDNYLFHDYFGQPMYINFEREIPNHDSFMQDRPLKREADTEMENVENKKQKY